MLRALRGIGDILCAVPALRALRAALPDAHVTLVGLPVAASLVARFPAYVDEFAAMPGFPALYDNVSVRELPAFFESMQARRFDLALQMHGSGIVSNPAAALLGAKRLAGFYLPGQWMPDPDLFAPYPADLPEPLRWLELTTFLGMPSAGSRLEFPLAEDDRADAAALLASAGIEERPYAVVHAGADDDRRRWPPERFASVAGHLASRGLAVVATGTASEAPMVAELAARTTAPVADLAGRTSLGALAALVERARIVVGNDTGISHIAAALRVPSVIVYTGAAHVQRWAPLDVRRHRRCGPPEGEPRGCGLPVNERCLRDGCTVAEEPFEPYFAPVRDVIAHVDELLAEEAVHVA